MNADRESMATAGKAEQKHATPETAKPCYDTIALKAYFIALDRHARGEPGDPLKDWSEAERQLFHLDVRFD